ncbi:hypothetical protein HSBGL_2629 [Halapricum desulfuricans]|uniref:Uncharacterized protein n=1 Tax=Halapricum desulfuricans TaxID=2841257 RepID=A0A897NJX0_9EURY|nr:hypothetical protein HSBGL_2629 [Halapricum desulfuricans]
MWGNSSLGKTAPYLSKQTPYSQRVRSHTRSGRFKYMRERTALTVRFADVSVAICNPIYTGLQNRV